MKILLLIAFLFTSAAFSQRYNPNDSPESKYRFSHIGVPDGLESGTVTCFYKDSTGFLWTGTSGGLNRYDGYKMQTFDPDPQDTLAIPSKDYRAIFEDPLGNIWVKTPANTFIFNPRTETFSTDQSIILNKMGIDGVSIKDIIKDGAGNYWFIHENGGITKYYTLEENAVPVDLSTLTTVDFSGEVASFKETEAGNYWIIFTNGLLAKLNGNTLKIESLCYKLQEKFPDSQHDFKMIIDDAGDIWLHLFEDYGIFHYDVAHDQLTAITQDSAPISLSSNLVSAIEIDENGMIWVATDHGGINLIDPLRYSVFYINNNPEVPNSLSHNSINSLYKDTDGIMWVGTFKNGIDYYHTNILRFPRYKNLVSDPNSLPYNDVNVFAEDEMGNLYIGTNGGGLLYLNKKTGAYTQFIHDPENPESISSNVVVSLLYDSNKDLWVGTYRGGLNKMTPSGFKKYMHDTNDTTSIVDNNIWELFEDSNQNLWVGTLSGGLDVMDREKEVFYHETIGDFNFSLHDTYVAAIAEDEKGNLWVSGTKGIDILHLNNRKQTYYAHDAKDASSISSDYILEIYADNSGRMWVGTQEGLNLFDENRGTFYRYTLDDGLPGNKIIAIMEDDENDLWLTSSYGITQFQKAPSQGHRDSIPANFKNYSDLDGLQGNLFNENAIFKTHNGEILIGGMHGYNRFDPQHFEYNKKEPKVIFTEFSLFNETVNVNEKINGRVILKKPLNATKDITLNYGENLFTVAFATLDLFQPYKNKYSYKLQGFDKTWQTVGSDARRVTYTNLDPGTYRLMVRASNNDQIWTKNPATLTIKILPPFYRTLPAYFCYVFAIIGILYVARKRIILRQRKAFKIEQDKREADHLHEMDLMKIRFFTNISHEFKTPLSLILAPLEKLRNLELNFQAREQLDAINKNAQKLLVLINQVLNLGNIKKDAQLLSTKGDVIQFIREAVSAFKSLAKNKGVMLHFKTNAETFYTDFDMDKLDKILFNLLSNAIKFTPNGGKVKVTVNLKNTTNLPNHKKRLEIKVIDTGIGISKKDQERIFERFFKKEKSGEIENPGSGIGLSIVKEYVDIYKGKINVRSNLGKGTMFKLKIPLKDLGQVALSNTHQSKHLKNAENDPKTAKKQIIFNLLIIDDDDDFLNYMAKSLSEFYNIFIAPNGAAGWKKTLSVRPDLIICDWAMPIMSGSELCEKIRNDNRTRHIPLIMLTANIHERDKLEALKIGVDDYMTKPFSFDVLQTRISNLIEQRKSFQEAYSKKIKIPKIPSKIQLESEDEKLMRKVVHLISSNISNPEFSVKKLASELGVSRTFLYNKTVVLFEKPPLDLITDMRLEKGKELLRTSQLTISEIAFQVGFNNPKYFSKNFKKKYGILPSIFKNSSAAEL